MTTKVHRSAAPRKYRPAPGELQQPEETGGTGSGWDDVGRIWTSPGGTASRPAWTNPSWGLSSATVAKGLDPETRWEATTTGGRGTGRQNRPVRGWDSSQPDMGRGFSGLQLRFPARAQPA